MAVTFVIGNAHKLSSSLMMPGNSIASALANEFTEAVGDLYGSALIELGRDPVSHNLRGPGPLQDAVAAAEQDWRPEDVSASTAINEHLLPPVVDQSLQPRGVGSSRC